ncbi:MAG: hypothetical protein RR123_05955 [Clostridia bacterium]
MNWLKLDNSAKIYPMMVNKKTQNIFALSCELFTDINKDTLQCALQNILPRFPSFNVKLMRGIFWYYFEENTNKPIIFEEDPIILKRITFSNCKGYNFRVSYFKNRITIDFFHAICDGTGAVEFMKALIFEYVSLLDIKIDTEEKIITKYSPIDALEVDDSFVRYYQKKKIKDLKIKDMQGKSAYHIEGITFDNGKGLIEMQFDVDALKVLAKQYKATITEYLGSLFLYSIYCTKVKGAKLNTSLQLFTPINLRKIFASKTLRNFSLFSRIGVPLNKELSFDDIIEEFKKDLRADVDKTLLETKISTTVRAEKIFLMRILPLVLKLGVFKFANLFFGKSKKTATFSNVGIIEMPEDLHPYVKDFSFRLNNTKATPINMSGCSVYGKMNVVFSRCIVDTEIEKFFARYLTEKGLKVIISSNVWEAPNAL